MKKITFSILITIFLFGVAAISANAQMMMGQSLNGTVNWDEVVEHTAREQKEGREVWDMLQAKELSCDELGEEQFGVLGEYFMGQMTGGSHAAMNAMMTQMHGEEGEEQIHIVMGKRLSGCDASAALPSEIGGWMPMMQMFVPYGNGTRGSHMGMWGGWSSPPGVDSVNTMMNFGYGFGFFGWLFMLLWWILVIAVVVALVKWLVNQFRGGSSGNSAVDILKERYARGEIDKKEFEERKRDIT